MLLPCAGSVASLAAFYTERTVARNLYILAGALLLFALVSFVMSMTSGRMQPALPASGTLWKTSALFLTVGGLIVALLGVMTNLFEQFDRRSEERRERHAGRGGPQHGGPGRSGQQRSGRGRMDR
jgi:uncharacterized membrane protein